MTDQNYKGEELPGNGDLLDLFVPAHEEGDELPLLIVSNGCAWTRDTGKNLAGSYREFFNERGWAVAGVSVRSGTQANSPSQIQDVKDSVRWLRAHADDYGLDPERFAFGGFSSGAWVAATAATMGDSDDPELEGTNPDTEGVDDRVQAFFTYALPGDFRQMDSQAGRPYDPTTNTLGNPVPTNTPGASAGYVHPKQIDWSKPVSVAGRNGIAIPPTSVSGVFLTHQPTNSPESGLVGCGGGSEPAGLLVPECVWAEKSSPVSYATPADPPGLIMHGGNDPLLPYLQSQSLYDNLTAAGVDVTYQWVGGQGHTGSYPASVANAVRRVQQSVDGVKLPVREYFGSAEEPVNDELPTMQYVYEFLADALKPAAPPTTPPTSTPPTSTPPATTPTPTPVVKKVRARIGTKVVKPMSVGVKRKLRVTLRARDVVPSGAVTIRVKGAGEKESYERTVNTRGRTVVRLPRFNRAGKVKVRVVYSGDSRVKPAKTRIKFAVVQRRTD